MSSQEVSKPVMITIVAVAVIVIGLVGWYMFLRPQKYPGYQAPTGGAAAGGGMQGPGVPTGIPGAGPGSVRNPTSGPPMGAPR